MLDNVIVIGAVIVISLLVDAAILVLAKILPKYNLTEIKTSRYEAGNIPIREPKKRLPMQYFGYMYMFMALEPVLVIVLLLSIKPTISFFAILGISVILFIPAIYFGYNLANDIAYRREVYE
ncbi:NADH dehydrogenase subunit A [Archaeoglobus sulfaticallidus PM70-1]|uniref:NADH dehydrogenase subunit A n=1 Tax=Archaeoglobus sulfaticallidus PM70-1 TaxID=387631 RepID=N0BHC2_9EURY|nr:NADH-quinone oxidoreductase subunit A [Archaeoglobus sulfaticallidus]AGK61717.1 NADH dehydrogenase subunit A [Archaeoglobus sulfaticallidus PM70-1]